MKRPYIIFLFLCLIIAGIVFLSLPHNAVLTTMPPVSPTPQEISPTIAFVSQTNGVCHAKYLDANDIQEVLPDSSCTPGSINPDVTQANIQDTICKLGFTKSIRPPATFTNRLKKEQLIEYGFTDINTKDYEEDHLISLELGGSPSDPNNLWPEPHTSPNEKDRLENALHRQVCGGMLTLQQAQIIISTDWVKEYKKIFLN